MDFIYLAQVMPFWAYGFLFNNNTVFDGGGEGGRRELTKNFSFSLFIYTVEILKAIIVYYFHNSEKILISSLKKNPIKQILLILPG